MYINNSQVVPGPTPSPTPSPEEDGLPTALRTDFKKEYLDDYNDQIVERVGIARRKLEWLIQVNRDKMAELKQASFSTKALQTHGFDLIQLEKMITTSQQSLRFLMTLVDADGCYNYYAFAAQPQKPRRPNGSNGNGGGDNEEQDLSLKTIVAYNDDLGLHTKNRLIDHNINAPPTNIQSIYTGLRTDYLGMLETSHIQHSLTQPSSLITSFTPYGAYQLTSKYKSEIPDHVKVHASLYTDGKVVATNPNGTKVHVTWPAKPGTDLNRLPIPMYKHHKNETAIRAIIDGINRADRSISQNFPNLSSIYSNKIGFYSNVCYNQVIPDLGRMYAYDKGYIDIGNFAFANQIVLATTIAHEYKHRIDWLLNPDLYSKSASHVELEAYRYEGEILKLDPGSSKHKETLIKQNQTDVQVYKDISEHYDRYGASDEGIAGVEKAKLREKYKKYGENFVDNNLVLYGYEAPTATEISTYSSNTFTQNGCN